MLYQFAMATDEVMLNAKLRLARLQEQMSQEQADSLYQILRSAPVYAPRQSDEVADAIRNVAGMDLFNKERSWKLLSSRVD